MLENLIPGHPRLTTRLAPCRPVFSLQRPAGQQLLTPRCDTVLIDTRAARCSLTWRVTIALPEHTAPLIVLACEDLALAEAQLQDGGNATIATSLSAPAAEPYPLASGPPTSLATLREQTSGPPTWSGDAEQTLHLDSASPDLAAIIAEATQRAAAADLATHDTVADLDDPPTVTVTPGATQRLSPAEPGPESAAGATQPLHLGPGAAASAEPNATQRLKPLQAASDMDEHGPAFPLATPSTGTPESSQSLDDIRGEGDAVHWSGPTDQTMHADHIPGDVAALLASLKGGGPSAQAAAAPAHRANSPSATAAPGHRADSPSAIPAQPLVPSPQQAHPAHAGASAGTSTAAQAPFAAPRPPDPLQPSAPRYAFALSPTAPASLDPASAHPTAASAASGGPAAVASLGGPSAAQPVSPAVSSSGGPAYSPIDEPSLIGPLATPEMRARHHAAREAAAAAPAPPAADTPASEPAPQEPAESPLPLDEYPWSAAPPSPAPCIAAPTTAPPSSTPTNSTPTYGNASAPTTTSNSSSPSSAASST